MKKRSFEYINSIEQRIEDSQRQFFAVWNRSIRTRFQLGESFRMEDFADPFGGYWLSREAFQTLDPALRHFYAGCTWRDHKIYLRGYDYYQADLVMNLYEAGTDHHRLWQTFQTKWTRYQKIDSFAFLNRQMTIESWIAALGLLEYLFSDLTSIRWFVFRNESMLREMLRENYCPMVDDVEALTEIVASALADLLKFRFEDAYETMSGAGAALIHSRRISALLESRFQRIEKASIRTMREGDCLALVYAAYLLKLEPFCREKQLTRIHIMSNAFGAMNIGILLKHLMSPKCNAHHTNILFAQHRSDGDVVYDDSLINRCVFINSSNLPDYKNAQAVFVVDDSICYGNTYLFIKEHLERDCVYLLPLTLNCNGMKYFTAGLPEQADWESITRRSVSWASEINGEPPVFFSFWDFRQTVPEDCRIEDPNQRFALLGFDMLLKHLWTLYLPEILDTGNRYRAGTTD